MQIELTQDQVKFLMEMINVLNFPGKEVENVYQIKQAIKKSLEGEQK